VTNGYLDEVPVKEVRRFEKDFLHFMQIEGHSFYRKLEETRFLDQDLIKQLHDLTAQFRQRFKVTV
jgi:F-type H+-transporting ATPase subunit alpha